MGLAAFVWRHSTDDVCPIINCYFAVKCALIRSRIYVEWIKIGNGAVTWSEANVGRHGQAM
jgi:hypothetical protein